MMQCRLYLFLMLLAPLLAGAQSPKVPVKMEVAGIRLKLTEAARREIQADVDKLTRYPKYFHVKVERANTYFPIIERVFREEKVPDDFKYLVLQESALISDAVSSSNAVGFWQFKDFTAHEMGMRVDGQVDERKHITSSSRAAARYFKKNNYYFNNWLKALQAYQMGAGGVMRAEGEKYNGAKSMEITKKTYWYVKKYLAHKVAFEGEVGKAEPEIGVVEYVRGGNKSLKEIAQETGVGEEKLREYNKWLKRGRVPLDKQYSVIIPGKGIKLRQPSLEASEPMAVKALGRYDDRESEKYPIIKKTRNTSAAFVRANGLHAIIAGENDDVAKLAEKGGLLLSKFLSYNDIDISHRATDGQVYYLNRKRAKAKTHFHTVRPGESLWSIAQKYGLRVKKLMDKNRIRKEGALKPGRVMWLRFVRPARIPVEYKSIDKEEPSAPAPAPKIVKKEQQRPVTESSKPKPSPIAEGEKAQEQVPATPNIRDKQAGGVGISHDRTKPLSEGETVAKEPVKEAPKKISPQDTLISEQRITVPMDTVVKGQDEEKAEGTDRLTENTVPEPEPSAPQNGQGLANDTLPRTTVVQVKPVVEKIHTVEKGETLYGLSKMYGVSVMNIAEWNGIQVQDGLSIGQQLKIRTNIGKAPNPEVLPSGGIEPSGRDLKSDYFFHEVKTGETLYSIARGYGVSIKELMEWNNKPDFNLILGEKLRIRKKRTGVN